MKVNFDTSNDELDRPLPKDKKIIRLIKDELGGKITRGFATLRPKTYSYLTNRNDENKKSKRHKKVCRMKPQI